MKKIIVIIVLIGCILPWQNIKAIGVLDITNGVRESHNKVGQLKNEEKPLDQINASANDLFKKIVKLEFRNCIDSAKADAYKLMPTQTAYNKLGSKEQALKDAEYMKELDKVYEKAKICDKDEKKAKSVVVPPSVVEPDPIPLVTEIPNDKKAIIQQPIVGYIIGKATLKDEEFKKELDPKIQLLKQYPDAKYQLVVEGHTCDLGTDEFNLGLGFARAEAVKNYLIEKGIAANRIEAVSRGERDFNKNISRSENRRVVILVK